MSHPATPINTVLASFKRLIPKDKKIVIACSGGADSMALLFIAMKAKYNIQVCHVLHDMRSLEEASKDKTLVQQFCEEFNLPFHLRSIERKDSTENLEDFYRKKRREHLEDVMYQNACHYIATGHHADDQLETILMKMCRGTGFRGLSGIAELATISSSSNRFIVRPLLGITKEECYSICKENSIPFVEDYTNADTDYARNAIRSEVLPVLKKFFPKCSEKFSEVAELTSKAQKMIEKQASLLEVHENDVLPSTPDIFVWKKPLLQCDDLVIQEWLRKACLKVQQKAGVQPSVSGINNFMYNEVIKTIRSKSGVFFQWPNKITVMVEKTHVRVYYHDSKVKSNLI